jgi:hypothetical protein
MCNGEENEELKTTKRESFKEADICNEKERLEKLRSKSRLD